jgi:hypothetical protein
MMRSSFPSHFQLKIEILIFRQMNEILLDIQARKARQIINEIKSHVF